MSELTKDQLKEAVRSHLEEVAQKWHEQSKMNLSNDDYGDGYASGKEGCAEHLLEVTEEIMKLFG